MKKNKQTDSQKKTELAKSIAKGSKSFKKTYTSLETRVAKAFRFFSNWIDRILFSQKYGKLVAVFLATAVCLIVNVGAQDSVFTNNMKSAVEMQKIEVVSNASKSTYEISELPETVDVTLTGDTSDVQYASQQKGNYQVQANLKDLGEGTHEVTLEPLNFPNRVDVNIKPNTVVVTVKKKVSRSFILTSDFINVNQMDKVYSLSKPSFAKSEVIVRASEERMAEIAYVKALIDVSDVKADFEQDARIVAYNQQGEMLDVDIVPETVHVKVKVSMPKKEVPIVIVPKGELPDGNAIASYKLSETSITLYAPKSDLENIEQLEVVVPVNKIKQDTKVTIPVMLPNGVSKGSIQTVEVELKLGKAEEKTLTEIPITVRGIKKNLKVTNNLPKANIKMVGAKEVLDSIKTEDITAVADLSKYKEAGEYKVSIYVKGKERIVLYTLDIDEVQVDLEKGE